MFFRNARNLTPAREASCCTRWRSSCLPLGEPQARILVPASGSLVGLLFVFELAGSSSISGRSIITMFQFMSETGSNFPTNTWKGGGVRLHIFFLHTPSWRKRMRRRLALLQMAWVVPSDFLSVAFESLVTQSRDNTFFCFQSVFKLSATLTT
jgi:hypothetical protein